MVREVIRVFLKGFSELFWVDFGDFVVVRSEVVLGGFGSFDR